MLPRHKMILELIKVNDVVYTYFVMYYYDDNVLHAFYELWRPSMNILYTFIGECPYHFGICNPLQVSPYKGIFMIKLLPQRKN